MTDSVFALIRKVAGGGVETRGVVYATRHAAERARADLSDGECYRVWEFPVIGLPAQEDADAQVPPAGGGEDEAEAQADAPHGGGALGPQRGDAGGGERGGVPARPRLVFGRPGVLPAGAGAGDRSPAVQPEAGAVASRHSYTYATDAGTPFTCPACGHDWERTGGITIELNNRHGLLWDTESFLWPDGRLNDPYGEVAAGQHSATRCGGCHQMLPHLEGVEETHTSRSTS